MQEIPINRIGIIKDSKHPIEIGWYVVIRDDKQSTGGYKLFSSNNINFINSLDGNEILFNNWVENYDDIERFVKGWKWQIEWTTQSLPLNWKE